MNIGLLVLVAALRLSAPDTPAFAAAPAIPLKPIHGEVIINRILLAAYVLSEGLNLQDTTRA